ncbi:MAG: 4Fe-4S binding protein [Bacillota bacterium]
MGLDVISKALEFGADLAGVAGYETLVAQNVTVDGTILPGLRSVIAIAARHGREALLSGNVQAAQYDTIYTYDAVANASHRLVRYLEDSGYRAVAVPAFIPIDMQEGKEGMIGSVDQRGVAVAAGLGTRGESGLLVTKRFGPRVRLGSVLTDAPLLPTPALQEELCTKCGICLERCPANALLGDCGIDKKSCARVIFDYGLRQYIKFNAEMFEADPEERKKILRSRTVREIWQNFMTGNYYYCWSCQANCPVGTV